jgi:hypothetical protein
MGLRAATRTDREGQIKALDRVQKRTYKFANYTNNSSLETSAHCRKMARTCALFKAYAGERAGKSIRDRLKGQCYLSRDNHDRKIRARKQRTDIGKYSFVNRMKLWKQVFTEARSDIFRERERIWKLIIIEEK